MQDYLRKSISDVIEEINDSYFLPDMQRDFVWNEKQVYYLFDSILRGYPINTFLFWILKGKDLKKLGIKKFEFVLRSDAENIENTSYNSEKEYYLVLDGQQRLTTFFLTLKHNYIIRNKPYELYFNLLSGIEEIDDILYEFKFYNKSKGLYFVETDDKKVIEKIWYGVKEMYDIQELEDTNDILDDLEKEHKVTFERNQKRAFSKLARYVKTEPIIYYYPEKEIDEERVLDIFIRTNSGGTQLSYSDLLFSNIKVRWKEAREKFNELINNINYGNSYGFDTDFLLKAILFINANEQSDIKYKTKNFNPTLIDKIKDEKYWITFGKSVKFVVDLIHDYFHLTNSKLISSYNAIIPLIYWVYINGIKGIDEGKKYFLSKEEINKMRVWFIKSLISGAFGGQSDSILMKCKEAIDGNPVTFNAIGIETKIKSDTKRRMDIEESVIDKIKYNDKTSYLVLSIIYKMSINFQPKFIGNIPEQDHLFSKDELKSIDTKDEYINTIYNIRYIGKAPNQSKSNLPFEKWILTQSEEDKKTHLIPKGKWNLKNFDEFLAERKKLVIDNFIY